MKHSGIFYMLLKPLVPNKVVNDRGERRTFSFCDVREIYLIAIPKLQGVTFLHKFMNYLVMFSFPPKISIYVAGPYDMIEVMIEVAVSQNTL